MAAMPSYSVRFLLTVAAALWLGIFGGTVLEARADWKLIWSDEFDGTALDTNKWWLDLGPGPCINGNGELEVYTNSPQNAYVSDGMLHIVALNIGSGTNYYLTSARLMTWNIDDCSNTIQSNTPFAFCYGAVEFRVKLPTGTGFWPALWLLPWEQYFGGHDPIYGNWPNSGEIDVMENNGMSPDRVSFNLIYSGGNYGGEANVGDITQWHIYRLNWTTNQFQWLVDGVTYSSCTNCWNAAPGFAFPAPFDTPFYIIMNLALGGFYTGSPTPEEVATNLPAEMDVDYVRVYQQVNPVLSVTQTSGSVIISWLQQPEVWVLEQAGDMSSTWTQVPEAQYQTNQDQISFTVTPPINGNMFFRLRQQ